MREECKGTKLESGAAGGCPCWDSGARATHSLGMGRGPLRPLGSGGRRRVRGSGIKLCIQTAYVPRNPWGPAQADGGTQICVNPAGDPTRKLKGRVGGEKPGVNPRSFSQGFPMGGLRDPQIHVAQRAGFGVRAFGDGPGNTHLRWTPGPIRDAGTLARGDKMPGRRFRVRERCPRSPTAAEQNHHWCGKGKTGPPGGPNPYNIPRSGTTEPKEVSGTILGRRILPSPYYGEKKKTPLNLDFKNFVVKRGK